MPGWKDCECCGSTEEGVAGEMWAGRWSEGWGGRGVLDLGLKGLGVRGSTRVREGCGRGVPCSMAVCTLGWRCGSLRLREWWGGVCGWGSVWRLSYLGVRDGRSGCKGTWALDWASWTTLHSWDFLLYPAKVFLFGKKKKIDLIFLKERKVGPLSFVDLHSLPDSLMAWRSCSSRPFLSGSPKHQGTALCQEELDPWSLLRSGRLSSSLVWELFFHSFEGYSALTWDVTYSGGHGRHIGSPLSQLTDARVWPIAKGKPFSAPGRSLPAPCSPSLLRGPPLPPLTRSLTLTICWLVFTLRSLRSAGFLLTTSKGYCHA